MTRERELLKTSLYPEMGETDSIGKGPSTSYLSDQQGELRAVVQWPVGFNIPSSSMITSHFILPQLQCQGGDLVTS